MSADLVLTLYEEMSATHVVNLQKDDGVSLKPSTMFGVDDTVFLSFKVKNQGDKTASKSYFKVVVDGEIVDLGDQNDFVSSIFAGGWHGYNSLILGKFGVGEHTITLTLDSTNVVAEGEAGEKNNVYTTTFTVQNGQGGGEEEQGDYADLVLTLNEELGAQEKLDLRKHGEHSLVSSNIFSTDDDVFLAFEITNQGSKKANSSYFRVEVDGNVFDLSGHQGLNGSTQGGNLGAMNPEYHVSYSSINLGKYAAGTHTIRFTLDPNNQVAEGTAGEQNNVYTTTFTVQGEQITTADLVLSKINGINSDELLALQKTGPEYLVNASVFSPDDDVFFAFNIKNQGVLTASSSYFKLEIDGEEFDLSGQQGVVSGNNMGVMTPGFEHGVSGINLGKYAVGTHTITFTLDPDNYVAEGTAGEQNNVYTTTFTVQNGQGDYADLVLTLDEELGAQELLNLQKIVEVGPMVSSNTFGTDDNVFLAFEITNQGSKKADSCYIKIEVDGEVFDLSGQQGEISTGNAGSFTPGYSYGYSAINLGKYAVGEHTIRFTLDPNNLVAEGTAGEANNVYETTFTVQDGQGGGEQGEITTADLVLTLDETLGAQELLNLRKNGEDHFMVSSNTFGTDDDVFLAFQITNQGVKKADSCYIRVEVDGEVFDLSGVQGLSTGNAGAFNPEYSYAFSAINLGKYAVGKHTITFTLDPTNRVAEGTAGEANNVYTTVFSVADNGQLVDGSALDDIESGGKMISGFLLSSEDKDIFVPVVLKAGNIKVSVLGSTKSQKLIFAESAEGEQYLSFNLEKTLEEDNSPTELKAIQDEVADVFLAHSSGETWTEGYFARNKGYVTAEGELVAGTKDATALLGKNKICDVFTGSGDPSVLILTDDACGDALFLDDIYSESGHPSKEAARLAQVDDIYAGAGDDVIDMTSSKFKYVGEGMTIHGGDGDDVLWSNKGSNVLCGDAGDDWLIGAGNCAEVFVGGTGDDTLNGVSGDNVFCFGEAWGQDSLQQAQGTATLVFVAGLEGYNWNAEDRIFTCGENTLTVDPLSGATLTIYVGATRIYGAGEIAYDDYKDYCEKQDTSSTLAVI